MGVKKKATKKTTAKKSGAGGKIVASALGAVKGIVTGKKSGAGGKRRSRQTPEKLARQILILRLKKRLYKMKYGGR